MTISTAITTQRVLWGSLDLCVMLGCALSIGSCAEGSELSQVVSPATARRHPPAQLEQCAEPKVVVEAPPCK